MCTTLYTSRYGRISLLSLRVFGCNLWRDERGISWRIVGNVKVSLDIIRLFGIRFISRLAIIALLSTVYGKLENTKPSSVDDYWHTIISGSRKYSNNYHRESQMCASASILITVLMNFQNVSYKTHITVVKGFYKREATYLRTHTTTA